MNDGISNFDDSDVGALWYVTDASTIAIPFGCEMAPDIDEILAVDAIDGDGVLSWTVRHNDITIVQFNSA